jgi:hypothetical protein
LPRCVCRPISVCDQENLSSSDVATLSVARSLQEFM